MAKSILWKLNKSHKQHFEDNEKYAELIWQHVSRMGFTYKHGYGSGIDINITGRFIRELMSAKFSISVDSLPVSELRESLRQYFIEIGNETGIQVDLENAVAFCQKLKTKRNDNFVETCLRIFDERRDELSNFMISSLFLLVQCLACAAIQEDEKKLFSNPKKLAELAEPEKIPMPLTEKIADLYIKHTTEHRITKTSWASKVITILGIHIKKIFGRQHGGRRNVKFAGWENLEVRAKFLFYCNFFDDELNRAKQIYPGAKASIKETWEERIESEFGDSFDLDLLKLLKKALPRSKSRNSRKALNSMFKFFYLENADTLWP